jgi:hypothetical protein
MKESELDKFFEPETKTYSKFSSATLDEDWMLGIKDE